MKIIWENCSILMAFSWGLAPWQKWQQSHQPNHLYERGRKNKKQTEKHKKIVMENEITRILSMIKWIKNVSDDLNSIVSKTKLK